MRRQLWIAFAFIFPISLTLTLFVFQARLDLLALSARHVAAYTSVALVISLGASIILVWGSFLTARYFGRTGRRLLAIIALYTLERAVGLYTRRVQADGIDEQDGGIIIRLATGSNESVLVGDKFEVLNAASRRKLGVLEVEEVEEVSCVCRVFDRIEVDFWSELEERMKADPSPPAGVTFSREIPPGWSDFLTGLIRNWGG